jgi:hypothetical protein
MSPILIHAPQVDGCILFQSLHLALPVHARVVCRGRDGVATLKPNESNITVFVSGSSIF